MYCIQFILAFRRTKSPYLYRWVTTLHPDHIRLIVTGRRKKALAAKKAQNVKNLTCIDLDQLCSLRDTNAIMKVQVCYY